MGDHKKRKAASASNMPRKQNLTDNLTNRYHSDVVRLWRERPEAYLTAGIGLVPLAPLTDVTEPDLPGLINRMADRINREPRPRAAKLWTATCLLMGLSFSDDVTLSVLEGVQKMLDVDHLPENSWRRTSGRSGSGIPAIAVALGA
jgi:hypothetical protein